MTDYTSSKSYLFISLYFKIVEVKIFHMIRMGIDKLKQIKRILTN